LRHDFVVLYLEQLALQSSDDALIGKFQAQPGLAASDRYAVAAWATAPGSL